MKRAILISGLGANEKAFTKIGEFGVPKVFVKWIPNLKDESLVSYSKRIIETYEITKQDALIGLSFGGLVCQQIAQILGSSSVILISSFRTRKDLNTLFYTGLVSNLYHLLPPFKVPILSGIIANFLNSGSKDSRPVLKKMLDQTDFKLLKWSVQKINDQKHQINNDTQLINIIGSNDKILKNWQNENTVIIPRGSHFMVFDQGEQITEIIKAKLS